MWRRRKSVDKPGEPARETENRKRLTRMETEILQTRVTSGRSGSGFQNNSKLQHAGRERDTREQGKQDGAVPSEGAGTEAR